MSQLKIKFSERLLNILKELEKNNYYIAFELLYLADKDSKYFNGLNISNVDIGTDYNFKVTISGKDHFMKIGKFIRYYFGDIFQGDEITKFSNAYNKLKNGKSIKNDGKRISISRFEYNPKDPRSTFLSLTTKTYPHGHEEEVLEYLPELDKDQHGNYYKIIGDNPAPSVMFSSHLDTADRRQVPTSLYSRQEDGQEIIYTDGTSILGADDKAGVTVMLYMMFNNVPGVYYFFIGEERGGVGSSDVSRNFDKIEHLQNIKRCVSFDRRNYHSIITSQYVVCCSDEFGEALSKEFSKSNLKMELDPTGIFTDSANFVDNIQECTNISVGYFDEHTTKEHQNITFLEKLAKACVKVNWEELPTVRKVGLDDDIRSQYYEFLEEFNETVFNCSFRIVNEFSITYIKFEIDEVDFDLVKYDIISLSSLFEKHDIDLDIYFEYDSIMIELLDKRHFKYLESFNSFVYESDSDDYNDDYLEFPEGSINELKYWLERMYSDNNLSSFVEANEDEISVYLFLDKVEKISTLFKVFEITDNISKYSLEDYSVEVELYENKEGYPVFKFDFKKN